ncbi:hypothetical protein FH972_019502 [Carpinus fangiana]|uniref:Peptidase A1 domain-containing protein n=1 Tax=Carpinus fangiana TaxID=176857 RepID=A0A5N6RQB8_9ROSI|nr:hypothetical protein FH972_019502 [Carpinus fangiana]
MELYCSQYYCSVTMLVVIILVLLITMASSSPFTSLIPSSYSSANTTATQSTFMSAVIFPRSFGVGVYFIQIKVGTPPVSQYMVLDTGSDLTWFQCKPCNCFQSPGLVFDPLNSTSLSVVPCDSAPCSHLGCNNNQCQYKVDYMDGSFTQGMLVLEKLTFGGIGVLNVFSGCGHSNHGLVTGADGLLGLGGGPLSLPTQLRLHGLADIFSYCLPQGMVFGSLGWLNFSLPGALLPPGTAWIPLLPNPNTPTFYYVGLLGIGIEDMRLPIPESSFKRTRKGFGGVIIDAGATYTHLPTPVYEVFRNAYVAKTRNLPRFYSVHPVFDTCYNLSGLESSQIPNVSFFFSAGPILTLKRKNILVEQEHSIGTGLLRI